jgi:hypothetical protein
MATHIPDRSETVARLGMLSLSEFGDLDWSAESLLDVVRADTSGLKARLYACEVLLRRDQERFLNIVGSQQVANIYATAMQRKITPDLNPWAFLSLGELGPFGQHLIACGDRALTALALLLDLKQAAGLYSGSIESKEGNSDRARICDFAAFFISRIAHHPFHFHRGDMAMRDAEIARLKGLLGAR